MERREGSMARKRRRKRGKLLLPFKTRRFVHKMDCHRHDLPGLCIHNLKGYLRPYPRVATLPDKSSEQNKWRNQLIEDWRPTQTNDLSQAKVHAEVEFEEDAIYWKADHERKHWCLKSHCEYWYFACRCQFVKLPSQLGRFLWCQYIASCVPEEQYIKEFTLVFYRRLMYLLRIRAQLNSIAIFDYGLSLKWLDPDTKYRFMNTIERLLGFQKSLLVAGFEQAEYKPKDAIRMLLALALGAGTTLDTVYLWMYFKPFTCPLIGYFPTYEEYGTFMKSELKKLRLRKEKQRRVNFDELIAGKTKKLAVIDLKLPEISVKPIICSERKVKTFSKKSDVMVPRTIKENFFQDVCCQPIPLLSKKKDEEVEVIHDVDRNVMENLYPSLADIFDTEAMNFDETEVEFVTEETQTEEIKESSYDSMVSMVRWVQSLLLSGLNEQFNFERINVGSPDMQVTEPFSDGGITVIHESKEPIHSDDVDSAKEGSYEEHDSILEDTHFDDHEFLNLDGQVDSPDEEEDYEQWPAETEILDEDNLVKEEQSLREIKMSTVESSLLEGAEQEIDEISVTFVEDEQGLTESEGHIESTSAMHMINDTMEETKLSFPENLPSDEKPIIVIPLDISEQKPTSLKESINFKTVDDSESQEIEIMTIKCSPDKTDAQCISEIILDEIIDVVINEMTETTDDLTKTITHFINELVYSALKIVVRMFVERYLAKIIEMAQEAALNQLIAEEWERNQPDICLLSEFKQVGWTKKLIRKKILEGLYFPLDEKERKYFGNDPKGSLKACYDYLVQCKYREVGVYQLRMLYKIALAGLNGLTKLCINFGYLADGTGETLLSIGAIREGNLVDLKLLCIKEELPSANVDKFTTRMKYNIPDLAWRKAKFLSPKLGVHLVMLCVQRYNMSSKFITNNMPLRSVHLSTGYRGVMAGQFALWYFDYTVKMFTFFPHTLEGLSFYVWHSRERLDNLIKRMLGQLHNLRSFEYYGTLQFLRTMDEICLYYLQHKTVIKRLSLFKIEDPCHGTKLRQEIAERRDKYAPMFAARNIIFNMGTFSL